MKLPNELHGKLFVLRLADNDTGELLRRVFMVTQDINAAVFGATVLEHHEDYNGTAIIEVWTPGKPNPDGMIRSMARILEQDEAGESSLHLQQQCATSDCAEGDSGDKASTHHPLPSTDKPLGLDADTSIEDILIEAFEVMKKSSREGNKND